MKFGNLLNGKYTPQNRPIQDLFTYHEIGVKELGLNWPGLFRDMSETIIEPVQFHYMRIGPPQGRLGETFNSGWAPEKAELLRAVLLENRRYLRSYSEFVVDELQLHKTPTGWECSDSLREATGGLSYAAMLELAQTANFRRALWQIAESAVDLMEAVLERSPRLRSLPMVPLGRICRRIGNAFEQANRH